MLNRNLLIDKAIELEKMEPLPKWRQAYATQSDPARSPQSPAYRFSVDVVDVEADVLTVLGFQHQVVCYGRAPGYSPQYVVGENVS